MRLSVFESLISGILDLLQKLNGQWGKAIALSGGNIFARISTALLAILLARLLTKSEYGALSYGLALAAVVSFLGDLGLQNTFLRESARTPWRTESLLSVVAIARLLLVFFFCATAFLYLRIRDASEPEILFVVALGAIGLTFSSLVVGAGLASDRVAWLVRIRVVSSIVLMVSVIGTLMAGGAGFIFPVYGAALLLSGLIGVGSLRGVFSLASNRKVFVLLRRMRKGLGGYSLSGLLFVVSPNLGILVLAHNAEMSTVGLFAIAMKIPAALYAIPAGISQSYYVPLSKAYEGRDLAEFRKVLKDCVLLSGAVGLALTALLILTAGWLSVLFSQQDNLASNELYKYLCISPLVLLIQSIAAPISNGLMTSSSQFHRAAVQAIACGINCLILFILVDRYKVEGALTAAIASELTYVVIAGVVLLKKLRGK